jgi:hypothetical protein
MRRFVGSVFVAVLLASSCTGAGAPSAPSAGARAGPVCGSWQVVDSLMSQGDRLSSVDVVGPDEAWAVGSSHRRGEAPGPWIVRLDPSGWRTMEYPGDGGEPDDVAALSSRDVWVVGEKILYFDGRGWVVSNPPAPASDWGIALDSVVALSPRDVWAVGTSIRDEGTTRGLVVHWNGIEWTLIETPATTSAWSSEFISVAAHSPADVWAVGTRSSADPGILDSTLAMHWDGSRWGVTPTPIGGALFYDVATFGKSDAWAVGTGAHGAIIERWDGSVWRVAEEMHPPLSLHSISAVSPADAWAVGGDRAVHWDGHTWTDVPTASAGAVLLDVSASAGDVWAVGEGPPRGGGGSVAELYC